jgi:hypothetical protein
MDARLRRLVGTDQPLLRDLLPSRRFAANAVQQCLGGPIANPLRGQRGGDRRRHEGDRA